MSLRDHGQEIALSDLANDIATGTTGPPRNESPPQVSEIRTDVLEDRVQELTVALHHVHIPKLTAAGVVEYNPDRGIVGPTESTRQIEPILELTEPPSSG